MEYLKIESAEDLIAQEAVGHVACGGTRSIAWRVNTSTIDIVCKCGIEITLGLNYLGARALEKNKVIPKVRPKGKTR